MILVRSHWFLRQSLRIRRVVRRMCPASSSEERARNLYLGKAPEPLHPLHFLWLLDGQYLNSWMLHGESTLFLWDVLVERRSLNILELGSGWSSLLFAKYVQHMYETGGRSVSVVSVEHEGAWVDRSERMLRACGLERFITISVCPLQTMKIDGMMGVSYDVGELGERQFDFVLIDGPPENGGRLLTLPSVLPRVKRGSYIVIDDAQRPAEYSACLQWRRKYGSSLAFKGFVPVGNGLAWLERV